MIPLIGPIISGIFGIGETYLKNKAEKVQATHEREVKIINGEISWDAQQAKNAGESWKDEFVTVVILSPFISMFFSAVMGWTAVVERHKEAFLVLKNDVPPEYWYLASAVVAASMGLKKIVDGVQKLRNK